LEDQAGSVKCVLWPEPFRRQGAIVADEATVLVNGRAEISDDGVITVIAEKLTELTQAVQQKARELVISLPATTNSGELCDVVKNLLEQSKGDCDVFVEVVAEGMLVRVRTHPSFEGSGQRRDRISSAKPGLRSPLGRFCLKAGRRGAKLSIRYEFSSVSPGESICGVEFTTETRRTRREESPSI